MNKQILCLALGAVLFALSFSVQAQEPTGKVPRIGLPVEQPKKFEFIINLKAAKRINLTIPQSVLYRADKVIR